MIKQSQRLARECLAKLGLKLVEGVAEIGIYFWLAEGFVYVGNDALLPSRLSKYKGGE